MSARKPDQVVIAGTATEVGEKAFLQVCLPMIQAAAKHATQREVAAMYLGFFSSMFGAMQADFGQEMALAMLRDGLEVFGSWEPLGGTTH